jgi:hypothetical protein
MSVKMMLFGSGQMRPLELSADNVLADNNGFSACGNPGSAGPPNLVITNGSGSYTILWEQIGDPADNGPYTCNTPNIQNPNWSGDNVCDGNTNDEQWRVTVTDLLYNQVKQYTITVTRNWTNIT